VQERRSSPQARVENLWTMVDTVPVRPEEIVGAPGARVLYSTSSGRFLSGAADDGRRTGDPRRAKPIARWTTPTITASVADSAMNLLIATQLGVLTGTHISSTSTRSYEVVRDWFEGLYGASLTTTALGTARRRLRSFR
jgi:hypothetical protein